MTQIERRIVLVPVPVTPPRVPELKAPVQGYVQTNEPRYRPLIAHLRLQALKKAA